LHTIVIALLLLGGCDLPKDPGGTLDRVRGGVLRIGVMENPPWVRLDGDAPEGIEPALIVAFAERLDARPEWVRRPGREPLAALEQGDLDIVIGGLTADSPWSDRVGFTRPYVTVGEVAHVVAIAPGENGFLVALERFLIPRETETRRRLAAELGQ
jgi:ABC-type amino acid transport substrate-binding protein